jgi:6-phosphogluconolactonase (cycloisomerase 2 family)
MSIPKRALGLAAFLCLTRTTSFAATELLYVQEGQNILTYSVNNTTTVTTKLGNLTTNYNLKQGPSSLSIPIQRSGSFLYVLGRSHSLKSFTVYPLTAAGIPMAKPVQILSVKH